MTQPPEADRDEMRKLAASLSQHAANLGTFHVAHETMRQASKALRLAATSAPGVVPTREEIDDLYSEMVAEHMAEARDCEGRMHPEDEAYAKGVAASFKAILALLTRPGAERANESDGTAGKADPQRAAVSARPLGEVTSEKGAGGAPGPSDPAQDMREALPAVRIRRVAVDLVMSGHLATKNDLEDRIAKAERDLLWFACDEIERHMKRAALSQPDRTCKDALQGAEPVAWQFRMADGDWVVASPPDATELEITPDRFRPLYALPEDQGER